MNWFKRHLNLTLVLVGVITHLITIVTFAPVEDTGPGRSVVGLVIQFVNPQISNETMLWFYVPIFVALMFPIEAWVIKRKGQSLWHLLWGIIPYGWIIILWLGSPKIDGNELQECLAHFEAETKVIAFQTKEADLYNNRTVKYSNSITVNPLAASEACKAAKRLSLAATEILRRHNEINNVPVAASAMHHAWYVAFYANAAWAHATAKAIEATAEGMNPNTMYIQQLVKEYQKAWRWADDEDKKFLKRLKVNAEDIAKIVASATTIDAADDDWEPKSEF
jgi:hypothetical protein